MADKPINYDPSCMDDYDPNSMEANLAQQHIIQSVQAIKETETVPIREALHRVLAQSLISSIDVPSHTNSAMDGYALNGDQLPLMKVVYLSKLELLMQADLMLVMLQPMNVFAS